MMSCETEAREGASAKEIKSRFTQIALLLPYPSHVVGETVSVFPNTGHGLTKVLKRSSLCDAGKTPVSQMSSSKQQTQEDFLHLTPDWQK